ncbi:MAG: ketoacyl-ACP synthase III [Candidatus Omnitrophica bacterium]|nr:ketoacyl-ACP synthase III [Candidatus Omnitrophota bacterium]MBU4590584.1 ketoacyl-ACP synthase III [Candidatus Omnitrophota bacterium]
MQEAGILGLGCYLPLKKITNADLEKTVETSDEWITTRTGIKERRIADKDVAASDLGAEAAKIAIKDAALNSEDIDLIITATITPDMAFPATACIIQDKIGAKNAAAFDINAACSGFVFAIVTAQQFVNMGLYSNVLVIGTEKLSSIVDWKDRYTCVLFGDGAGACVVGRSKDRKILSSFMGADGSGGHLLSVPAGGSRLPATESTVKDRLHFLKMEGNEVFKIAVRIMVDAANKAIKKAGLGPDDISLFIPHQANIRILMAVAKRLGVPKEKIFMNIEKYGNMSAASTAVALAEASSENRIKKGDNVVLVAFGGGLTYGAVVIKW